MAYNRLRWNINQGRYPALVVCKHIAHCENLYKFFKKKLGDAIILPTCMLILPLS